MLIWLLCCGTPSATGAAPLPDPAPAAPVPLAPGTPAESLAARPVWDTSGQYAPQAPAEARLFSAPADGDVTGLVICSIEADASDPQGIFGRFAEPDLTTTLTLDGARMKAVGPEDSRTMRISAPLIALAAGAMVRVSVDDRDVFKTRPVETVTGRYDGRFPLVLTGERVSAACTLVPPYAVEQLAVDRLPAVRRGLEDWERRGSARLQSDDLGAPDRALQAALHDVAGLVGWQDARVAALVGRWNAVEATYRAQLDAALRATQAQLDGRPIWLDAAAWGPGVLACDEPAAVNPTCRVQLPVSSQAPMVLGWPMRLGPVRQAQLVSLAGTAALSWDGTLAPDGTVRDDGEQTLLPGGHTLLLSTSWAALPEGPVLLRVADEQGIWRYVDLE